MLTLEEIIDKLKDRRLRVVANEIGLSYDTVRRIANGYFRDPSYKTVKLLSDYLTGGSNG